MGAHINNPACHFRPCDGPELARGEAEAVLREVLDDCRLSEIQEAVHQVVQPVRRKDGQVHDAQSVPQREAIFEGMPLKGHLQNGHTAYELSCTPAGHSGWLINSLPCNLQAPSHISRDNPVACVS